MVGFKTRWIEYENVERVQGKTKWSFWGLFKYAIEGIVSFTSVLLRFASIAGTITSFLALIYTVFIVVKTIIYGVDVQGYSSLVSIILFIGGIQLLGLGIIGEYISRIYMEVKKRPNYIIRETNI